ncbi:MAG: serine/threonine protein kinase [Myxococcota bacterium]
MRILARIAETMASAHAKGVMHLDLKPANIILQPYGQVSIIDWGLARFHDIEAYAAYLRAAGETATPQASAWEGFAGTPSYMPAEQARGGAGRGARGWGDCGARGRRDAVPGG